MKTFEIKTSRSRWTSLLIAVLLVAMLVTLCCPYFSYGKEASVFAPEAGYASFLGGKWILSGTDASQDGYKEVEIDAAVKTMTVNTTNIIRVNQLNADAAVEAAVAAYDDLKSAYEASDAASQKLAERAQVVEDIYAAINSVNADNAVNEGLVFEYFASEVEGVEVSVPKDAPIVLNAETIAAIQGNAKKSYDKLVKYINDANEAVATIEGNITQLQDAVNAAVAGAAKAYEADASYAWVTEDKATFQAAFDAANPAVREGIVADNIAAVEDLEKKTEAYNAALEKTTAAKAVYEAALAAANAKIENEKKAYDDAVAAGEAKLAELKAEYDATIKAGKAAVAEKADAYAAAVTAANEKFAEIKAEFEKAEEADVAEANANLAKAAEEGKAAIDAAKAEYEAAAAANTAAAAETKAAYDAAVAAAKAESEAAVATAKAAYDAAAASVTSDYADQKAEYQKLKKESDAAKKAIPSKVALYSEKEVDDLVAATAGTNRDLDNAVYAKLAAEKAKAAEGYEVCKNVQKASDDAVKAAEKAKKAAEKALKDFEKEIAKLVDFAAQLNCKTEFDVAAPSVTAKAAPEIVVGEYEKNNDEPAMMTTTGKVKFNDKKNLLTLTFANGDEIETAYTNDLSYNGVKKLSILGYVGFPYNVPDFDSEMAYNIKDFYINDVVLVPIILMILAIAGIILNIVKCGKMSAGYVPAVFALVGIFGYLFSDFLKLGDKFGTHMIGYVVVLVVTALHIFFAAKEKKAK